MQMTKRNKKVRLNKRLDSQNEYLYLRLFMNFTFLMLILIAKGVKKHGNDNITILFWNFFWEIDRMGEGNSGFVKNKCKYTNCFTSNDRADLYRTDKRVDAVIVHGLLSPDFKNEFKNFKLENVVNYFFHNYNSWTNEN